MYACTENFQQVEERLRMESKDDTLAAIRDPKVGDRYTEFMSFFVFVLARDATTVTYFETHSSSTSPADSKLHTTTLEEFIKYCSYTSGIGSWLRLIRRGDGTPPKWAESLLVKK